MKKKIVTIMTLVISANLCFAHVDNSNVCLANTKEDVKSYVALAKKTNVEKQIGRVDGFYEESSEGNYHIYQFEANEKEAEDIDSVKGVYVSEDVEVAACGKKIRKRLKNKKTEWNMNLINDKSSYDNKNSIDIAILDSGIDYSADINVVDSIDLVYGNNDFDIFADFTGHGTAIAGIIGSTGETEAIKGINSNVNIYSARILDENNQAPISRVVEGIYWAIEKNVKIINISFGTSEDSDVLRKAIDDAVNKDILVIAAAGNTGGEVIYPAAYDGVMAIGSVDSEGEISEFSANDASVDVMAPGENVKSVGALNGSVIVSGTSISAPHVVGLASLLWQKDKNVSADFIKELVIKSSNESKIVSSKRGIIDIEYAFEIYDSFKKEYNKNTKKVDTDVVKKEFVNHNKIQISENNYVEGNWSWAGHEDAAQYAGNNQLSAKDIKILKIGAVYPDKSFGGMYANPFWHTAPVADYYNYVSSYTCAGLIAKSMKKNNIVTMDNVTKPNDMSQDEFLKALRNVNSITWTKDLLGGYAVNADNKGMFCLGMALHALTDAYAHQAYMKDGNGKWYHLTHKKDQDDTCDNHKYAKYKNRFNCAKNASKNAVKKYLSGGPGFHDYLDNVDYQDFKLKRFKAYVLKQRGVVAAAINNNAKVKKANID